MRACIQLFLTFDESINFKLESNSIKWISKHCFNIALKDTHGDREKIVHKSQNTFPVDLLTSTRAKYFN